MKNIEKFNRYLIKPLVLIIVILSLSSLYSCKDKNDNKPNIIYILADDLGYGDVSCLNPNSKIPTPNIDKLASEGITFTDAHSGSAVCTPTRYGILTGRYAWRSRLQAGVLWIWNPPLIEENRLTVPAYLKDRGYHTACIGKWHLGWNWQDKKGKPVENAGAELGWKIDFNRQIENGPTKKGFDYYFGTDVPNFPPYCFIENDRTIGIPNIEKPDSIYGRPGVMLEGWDLRQILPELEKKAVQYIHNRAKDDNPFFLYFPLTAPHTPIAPAKEFQGKSNAGAYGDFVNQVDAVVGRIMEALEQEGIADNTLLIFTSDNGSPGRDGTDMAGPINSVNKYDHYPSYIYRGIKADIWEGGHHVPFIARWPKKIKAGSKSNEVICLTDFFSTTAAIFNDKLPDNAAEDSYNILPALTGENYDKPIREATVHHSSTGMFSIRQGKWKLEICPGSGGWTLSPEKAMQSGKPMIQLYDLSNDIKEQHNLLNRYPDVVYRLTTLLEQYVERGRSTPGIAQKNDGDPDIWKPMAIRNARYNISHINHIGVGKPVHVKDSESIKYTKSVEKVLSDGIRGSSWYNDGYWAGIEGEDLTVVMDLRSTHQISKVAIGFLEDQNYWIFHPVQVEFALSEDGKNFKSLSKITSEEPVKHERRIIKDLSADNINTAARYIKITAKNLRTCPTWHKGAGGKTWIFIDEIIIE
ncbi:MAG: sulfatase-like hydrolase/transferase [Bacteroidota bacterium]